MEGGHTPAPLRFPTKGLEAVSRPFRGSSCLLEWMLPHFAPALSRMDQSREESLCCAERRQGHGYADYKDGQSAPPG